MYTYSNSPTANMKTSFAFQTRVEDPVRKSHPNGPFLKLQRFLPAPIPPNSLGKTKNSVGIEPSSSEIAVQRQQIVIVRPDASSLAVHKSRSNGNGAIRFQEIVSAARVFLDFGKAGRTNAALRGDGGAEAVALQRQGRLDAGGQIAARSGR